MTEFTRPTASTFIWHPKARAFPQGRLICPNATPLLSPTIAPRPTETAVQQIAAALANRTPFCVTDQTIHQIGSLSAVQFATQTGGTSGAPKVIARSQASWIASFHANAAQFAYTPNDRIALLGNLGHSLTLYGLMEGLHLGLDAHVLNTLTPSQQTAQIGQHQCSIIYATPTQLRLLPTGAPLPNIRLILCGGGMLNTATRHHIARLFPNAALHVFYGAAETSFITMGGPDTPQGSVGHVYPEVRIDIRDPDATGIGTVWVSSPYLADGYLQGSSPHTLRDGDWMTVGELGSVDAQGNLFLHGRAGRTVTIADDTIHLDALQAMLAEMPDMPACVLMTRLDEMRGHHIVAVIEGPAQPSLSDDIKRFCAQHKLRAPREVAFLDPLPLLPSGKADLLRIAELTGTAP